MVLVLVTHHCCRYSKHCASSELQFGDLQSFREDLERAMVTLPETEKIAWAGGVGRLVWTCWNRVIWEIRQLQIRQGLSCVSCPSPTTSLRSNLVSHSIPFYHHSLSWGCKLVMPDTPTSSPNTPVSPLSLMSISSLPPCSPVTSTTPFKDLVCRPMREFFLGSNCLTFDLVDLCLEYCDVYDVDLELSNHSPHQNPTNSKKRRFHQQEDLQNYRLKTRFAQ